MNENGRKADYLIEDRKWIDQRTGVETTDERSFVVWCDEQMQPIIEGVEGVKAVYSFIGSKTEMSVYIDARYDKKIVQAEIAAAIQNQLDKETHHVERQ